MTEQGLLFLLRCFACLIPLVSANPSGLTYLDSTWSTNDGDEGDLLAINPNGTILASYHGKDIILFNTTTLSRLVKSVLMKILQEWNLIPMVRF